MGTYTYILQRLFTNENKRTFGRIFGRGESGKTICYTLEDIDRITKVWGETRINAGHYKLGLRTQGRLHKKYKSLYYFHQGMIWITNVPEFKYVYLHIGNTEDDTMGCPLVGSAINAKGLTGSTSAYRRFYKDVMRKMDEYDNVYLKIVNESIYT